MSGGVCIGRLEEVCLKGVYLERWYIWRDESGGMCLERNALKCVRRACVWRILLGGDNMFTEMVSMERCVWNKLVFFFFFRSVSVAHVYISLRGTRQESSE